MNLGRIRGIRSIRVRGFALLIAIAIGLLRTVYACNVRECTWSAPAKEYAGKGCPIHADAKLRKPRTEEPPASKDRPVRGGQVAPIS